MLQRQFRKGQLKQSFVMVMCKGLTPKSWSFAKNWHAKLFYCSSFSPKILKPGHFRSSVENATSLGLLQPYSIDKVTTCSKFKINFIYLEDDNQTAITLVLTRKSDSGLFKRFKVTWKHFSLKLNMKLIHVWRNDVRDSIWC